MTHGCYNRPPFKDAMIVADGYFIDGVTRTPRLKSSPFRMARDCQYTLSEISRNDTKCHGCIHRKEPNER